jgi:ABC-type antimicrobial peptide transport system ATPase subunit
MDLPHAPPLLEVKDLVVEFPSRRGVLRALDGVSFSVAAGEVLGVVGESGAGKSLTGASIIGLLEPPGRIASGSIWFDGQRIDNLDAEGLRRLRGRHIGAIFQDPLTSLNPLYSVGQQLVETIQAHLPVSTPEARERAVALLQETGIAAADAIHNGETPADVRAAYSHSLDKTLLADHRMAATLAFMMSSRLVARFVLSLVNTNDWTRTNFARWMFEDEPRAVIFTPRRWHRKFLKRPGAYQQ